MRALIALLCLVSTVASARPSRLPTAFDLRSVEGKSYVSAVKNQSGGTCWTHGTMAAIESNLMVTSTWMTSGESGEPALAEYHLDWWNGFNQHFNEDIAPETGGLTVHQGGDYRVAAAYLARGGGAVRKSDGQSFSSAPEQSAEGYHFFYVRDIEWYNVGEGLENIEKVKQAIMENGALGTALAWSSSFFNSSKATFYQPASSSSAANHAVAIVGWDDEKKTQAPEPGAWLIKNSWGPSWGQKGYFWISYYDKVAGHDPQMGAVAFRNVEPLRYSHIYSHDYHGWRDTKEEASEAFNAFTGTRSGESISAVSFYTADDTVEYQIKIYLTFSGGELKDELTVKEGIADHQGLHTVDLNFPVSVAQGKPFYVYVKLSKGGHPFDKTSNVPVLLGGSGRPIVQSRASAGESFYRTATGWKDLTEDDETANFCIKALANAG